MSLNRRALVCYIEHGGKFQMLFVQLQSVDTASLSSVSESMKGHFLTSV